jgi:putative two-component system response regulator
MSEMFLEQLDYKGARVLVVDDNPMNVELVADNLEQEGYAVERAFSGEEALRKVDAAPFDLVLLDVMMPGLTGYDVCERLKRDQKTRLLPVVMLTALDKREDKIRGIAAGADDFINKPFDRAELLIRVKSCIRTKRLTDDLETAESILVALGNAIDAKDTYTEGHAERVAHYSVAIGKQLGLPYEALRRLRLGGVLHDIGKIGVPEAILNKPGPLTTDEFAVMKKHPEIGERICAPLKSLREMLPVIRSHHERPNGSGYPDGLAGDEIPVEARIVCLADVYDALATTRSYKRAFTRERCIAILRDDTAKGLFDPQVVEAFVAYLSEREEAVRGRR